MVFALAMLTMYRLSIRRAWPHTEEEKMGDQGVGGRGGDGRECDEIPKQIKVNRLSCFEILLSTLSPVPAHSRRACNFAGLQETLLAQR